MLTLVGETEPTLSPSYAADTSLEESYDRTRKKAKMSFECF